MNNTPLKRFQGEETLDRYEQAPVRLLLLLIRTVNNTGKEYQIPLPANVKALVEKLRKAVYAAEEDRDKIFQLSFATLRSLWACESQWIATAENPIPDPTIRVVVLHQLQNDGRWWDAAHGTPILAKFQYMMVSLHWDVYH